MPYYPTLAAEMARKGITKKDLSDSHGKIITTIGDMEITQGPIQETVITSDGKCVPVSWKITCRRLNNNRPQSQSADGSSGQSGGHLTW